MKHYISFVLLLLGVFFAVFVNADDFQAIPVPDGVSGFGTTTRYWDCCKPTCAWAGNTVNGKPIVSCANDGYTIIDGEIQSGCVEGDAYICNDQRGYAVNDTFAIGFVAASFPNSYCCACVLFTFLGELEPKQMLVQFTNTGGEVAEDPYLFDIAMPASGVGYYDQGCTRQWGDGYYWGNIGGGIDYIEDCQRIPEPLREGCEFRFTWMRGVSNPNVTFYQVECPKELTDISQCVYEG